MLGARDFGIESLFLTAGIHGKDIHDPSGAIDGRRLEAFLAQAEAVPTYVMQKLGW